MRVVKSNQSATQMTFVLSARDSGGRRHVVLRTESGETLMVDFEDFIADYVPVNDSQISSTTDVIKETLNSIRQASTLRFAALTVFLGVFGALASAYYKTSALDPRPSGMRPDAWIVGAGLLLAVVGSVFEFVLSHNLLCWWHAIKTSKTDGDWAPVLAHRKPAVVWLARIAMFLPYPAMTAFWIQAWTCNPYAAVGTACSLFGVTACYWYAAARWRYR